MTPGGIDIRPRTFVRKISQASNGKVLLELTNGTNIETDHVVCALGIQPNNSVAKSAGLELDPTNEGIIVNAELEARRDVFAVRRLAAARVRKAADV